MTQLYYAVCVINPEGNVTFRKASPFPFPSPLGTAYSVPVGTGFELYVACYSHEDSPSGDVLYMLLSESRECQQKDGYPMVHGYNTPEERATMEEAGWEEVDEANDVVDKSTSS